MVSRLQQDFHYIWTAGLDQSVFAPRRRYQYAGGPISPDRLDRAIEHWREAIRIDPDDAVIRSSFAGALKQHGDRDEAVKILNDVRREIGALKDVDAQEFFVERERSLEALDSLESLLDEQREPTRRETLEIELDRALANEAYELAATLRDELQGLDDIRG